MRSCGLIRSSILSAKKTFQFHSLITGQLRLYCSESGSRCSNLLVEKDPVSIATALSLSENLKSYFLGTQIHAHIIRLGLVDDVFSQNNLIKMYAKCGVFKDGYKVFDEMTERNLVSWTLMISGAVQNGEHELGLEFYLELVRSGLRPNEFSFGSVLKACATLGAYEFGLSIHCYALKMGIEQNLYVGGSILSMYAKLEDIQLAERVFESMPNLDVGCWNVMIGGYVQCGRGDEALNVFSLMLHKGISLDCFTFVNALKGCSVVGNAEFGKQIHGLIIKSDVEYGTSLMNCLMDMYFRNERKASALKVFYRIRNKDVISWNTVFSLLSQDKDAREIVSLFHEFMLEGINPNNLTFSVLFRLCGEVLGLDLGLQFYCLAIQFGLHDEVNVTNSLINMFSRCKAMEKARLLFDNIYCKDITTWNQLISGYSLNHCYLEGLKIFLKLWSLGVESNEYTFSSLLEACFQSENQWIFKHIHCAIIKCGFSSNGYVCSLLINGYVNFGSLNDSFQFFNGFDRLDSVSWGTMISALVHQGHMYEAIKLLNNLMEAGGKLDEFILGSMLNYCARVSGYHLTKTVHSHVVKSGLERQVFVASGIIDAYAKCGKIDSAKMAYSQSFGLNDVVIFNTMIMAYAQHGLIAEAMEIFKTMKSANLQPSQATFVSVISACSHMGLVDEGFVLFESMILDYKMEPSQDVYGCLVDMLSRNGRLENARQIIEEMPFAPWPAIFRSLLSGCRIHGNRELGEWTAKKLLQLVPEDDAPYILLSKVYSEGGLWEDAGKVRRSMVERGVSKDIGCSWIEI
ncbi:Tetratricopeptide-like helical domain containing protein [Trema orientale]|uniref:Tetratricopeptide-like helical domain containing protein n=1 Tax=Trema orientale TaxID=63057 RepID=A0A2P5F0D2_TREOI|nr:Tetratricopeptide-like helical domain containing protein [Trema orientale]